MVDATLRQQIFKAITNGLIIDDEAHGKMMATAADVTQEVRADATSVPAYALVGFDPRAPETSTVLEHVEKLVEVHWPSLRNAMADRPIALLRCVLVIGLLDVCDELPNVASVLYLSLRDVLCRLAEPHERELRKSVILYLQGLHDTTANRTWREEITFESKKVGKIQFALSETVSEALVKQLEGAVDGKALDGTSTPSAEVELRPEWRASYASKTAAAVIEAISSLGAEIASKLPHQLRNAEMYHEAISTVLNDAIVARREGKLLWWLQAKHSTSLQTSYRSLNPFEGAFHMARDLHALVPVTVPDEVEAVLHEAIITAYGAVVAQEEKGLQEVIELLASQTIPEEFGEPLQNPEAGRLPFLDVVRLARWNSNTQPNSESWMGLPADTPMTPVDLALWVFRNTQVETLLL